jgi:intein-encoded DNA endonuclease-like protein
MYRKLKEYGIETRDLATSHIIYPKKNFSGNLIEKAYLIGFRIGDLNVRLSRSKNLIIARCTSTKMAQIQLFKNLFKKYGHIYVGKIREDRNREFLVRLNRTFNFLLPKKDNIPKWVRINNKYFLFFLAGYTDAEGCIGIGSKNVAFLALASYDKNILKQIHKQLIKIGVECKPPRILVKKGHIKSDGLVYRNDYWRFTINRKSFLLPVLRLLKLRLKHRKKINDLLRAEQNIIKRNQKTLPEKNSLRYLPV